jgi:outer membrane protein assembly factor BamB
VKLDTRTGKLEWFYQLTPHALCDWSLQGPPILVDAGRQKLVVAAGRAGIVVALDRSSGDLVWKHSVGRHNGHDNDGARAMRGDFSNLKIPMTVFPGSLGGVQSPISTNGSAVFVPVMDYPTTLVNQRGATQGETKSGEIIALEVGNGTPRWRRALPDLPAGPTSVVNDLVLASTFKGTAYALDARAGNVVWTHSLPAGIIGGLAVSDETLLVPATVANGSEQPQLIAYRLDG